MLRPRIPLRVVLRPRSIGSVVRLRPCLSRGFASNPPPPPSSNPTTAFYKTFTRPIAKVLLLAVFTYQVVYWAWVKLETEEVREQTDATMKQLEAEVDEYKKSKAGGVSGSRAS